MTIKRSMKKSEKIELARRYFGFTFNEAKRYVEESPHEKRYLIIKDYFKRQAQLAFKED